MTIEPTEPVSGQAVKVCLEIVYSLESGRSIIDAMDGVKELLETARNHGSVTGHIVFGRKKYPIS